MRGIITISLLAAATAGALMYSTTGQFHRIAALHFPKSVSKAAIEPRHLDALRSKAADAKSYASAKGFNTQICFLIDMNMASGANRFFVYDLRKDSIRNAAPVTHGRCNEDWLEGRRYGNTVGCGCSSLGRYRVGKSYHGRFGLAYKLHGLDKTNDKAFERYVVLHSHECVPSNAVEEDICQSDGCPTVSPGYLAYLKPIIDKSAKPVLLWIYDSSLGD